MASNIADKSLGGFRKIFAKKLSLIYPKTEIDSFFFLLIDEILDLQSFDVVITPHFLIPPDDFTLLKSALKRLENQEPIQYILGKTNFFGLPFLLNKNTLIPRPETEELVDWILQETKNDTISILDIGTGTGCIAIALAKNLPNATVFGVDIDQEALTIAKQNGALNDVNVHFLQTDILQIHDLNSIKTPLKFDIIVSNPPYVRELEKSSIKNNVLKYEPHSALFVLDDNPLLFYKKIATLAKKHLIKKGCLFFEINQYLGRETLEMLASKGFSNTELRQDIFKNDRMIKGSF